MYTLKQISSNGKVISLERLGKQEIREFVESVYGKWSNIHMTNDNTGETRVFLDDGEKWDRIQ